MTSYCLSSQPAPCRPLASSHLPGQRLRSASRCKRSQYIASLCINLHISIIISIYVYDRKLLGLKGVTGSFSVTSLQVFRWRWSDWSGRSWWWWQWWWFGWLTKSDVHNWSQNKYQEEEQVVRPGHLATAEQEIERFERKFILPLQSSLVVPCSHILHHRRHFSRMTAGTGPRAVLTRATQAL